MNPPFEGPCIIQQDEARGEPIIALRRAPDAPVEVLTVQQANALLDEFNNDMDEAVGYWWDALYDLIEGIRQSPATRRSAPLP